MTWPPAKCHVEPLAGFVLTNHLLPLSTEFGTKFNLLPTFCLPKMVYNYSLLDGGYRGLLACVAA